MRMGAGPYEGCKAEALSGDTLIPVVSRSVFETLDADHAEALTRLDLLHNRDPQASWSSWFSVHPIKGVDAARGPRFTSSDLVLTAASAGLGCALARRVLAAPAIKDGSLVPLFDGERTVRLPSAYWLIRPVDEATCLAVRTVADGIEFEAGR